MFGNIGKKIAKAVQKSPAAMQKLGNAMSKPLSMPKNGVIGSMLSGPSRGPGPDPAPTQVEMKKGGYTKSADGIAQRGKTRGKMC